MPTTISLEYSCVENRLQLSTSSPVASQIPNVGSCPPSSAYRHIAPNSLTIIPPSVSIEPDRRHRATTNNVTGSQKIYDLSGLLVQPSEPHPSLDVTLLLLWKQQNWQYPFF